MDCQNNTTITLQTMVNQTIKSNITDINKMIITNNDWTSDVFATNHIPGIVIETEIANTNMRIGLAEKHDLQTIIQGSNTQRNYQKQNKNQDNPRGVKHPERKWCD